MFFCLFMQMNMVETQAATKVGNTKITSITQTGKKSVKVAFKKVSGAKGYTLQYRTAGGSWKTKNVTKNKLTISKLSTGKTYQFRVRAYKNVNGKKKYGKYSGVKKSLCVIMFIWSIHMNHITVIIMKPIQMGTILRWAEKNKRRVLHLGRIHLGMKNLQTLI